ncbi:hypothetical protein L596_020110 [Steinernema carpocapsae]|uniref:MAM domain-containing protein n=1 Tax=Steinernema carpocapsae TaxID=34508 RepID=A0A4U5MSS0_STECR|nr:hypothetical protein L596_020110 [Steinernema carpocapsae]
MPLDPDWSWKSRVAAPLVIIWEEIWTIIMFCVYALRVFGIILGFFFGGTRWSSPGVTACSPMNLEQLAKSGIAAPGGGAARIFGNPTHAAHHPIALMQPISDSNELHCLEFDERCRWKNLDRLDGIIWMYASGPPSLEELKAITGTSIMPEGNYIVALSADVLPEAKAIFVSDVITCQAGQAEVRLEYWTSPGVKIRVCVKKHANIWAEYDYCNPPTELRHGHLFATIPDMDKQPFQIYIIAQDFVFTSPNIRGGVAIVDNIQYYGDMCSNPAIPTPPPFIFQEGLEDNLTRTVMPSIIHNSPCVVLMCSFSKEDCVDYIRASDWRVSSVPVGNPLTGIRGDASILPYNKNGSFAYVEGPKVESRFRTRSFKLDDDAILYFGYYKVNPQALFRVISKREGEPEKVGFEAPKMTIEKRWFKEAAHLKAGIYEYLVFEVTNLPANNYVGIDELILLNNTTRLRFC